MMYQVILNDVTPLYGVDIENSILSPSLEVELNSAGTFSFTLPPTHSTMTDNWYAQPDVLSGEIDVYEGDNIVWFGRPLEVARDWNNQKVIKCEGALAYFNDTVQRPKEFDKQWWLYEDPTADPPITKGFINYIIEEHNKQVTANHTIQSNREIILGNVTVDNDRVYRQTDYNTTADALQQMCLDTDGGYFILRKEYVMEDGNRVAKRYLDWTKDVPGGTGQPAAFGLNLLELNQDLNGADIVTVLIPTGEDDILINNNTLWNDTDHLCPHNSEGFTFLHNPGDDELTWKEGYEKYGRILKQKDWSDISEKSNLQQRACEWMRDQNEEPVTVECTAADLHYLKYPEYQTEEGDQKYDPFFVGEKVQVVSSPHGLTKELPIYKISINLDSGVKRMSIGTPPKRELTDIVKTGGGSTRGSSGTSGTSSGDSGGSSGSVTIPVKDVRVKKAGEEVYKSVVKKKIAKIDLSDLGGGDVEDVQIDGTSIVNEGIANIDSSQFGTKVVANPSDTPTDDLTSIKIGSTVYDIPGGGGGGGTTFMSDYYDTTERVVGRWTDGKPLYQKTAFVNMPTGNYNNWFNHNISGLTNAEIKHFDYDIQFMESSIGKNAYYSSSYNVSIARVTTTQIYFMANGWNTSTDIIIQLTLQYTKTTDAPGTGPTTGNLIYLPALYSEEEREVGVWTDGKPLYQITHKNLSLSIPANTWTNTGIPFTNIDTYKVLYNKSENQGADSQYPMLYRFDNGNFQVFCQWAMPLDELTLQYTKTTDTPGSGTWTPEGLLAHHYSTSEHIVGTWIDGSTIYERTWDLGRNVEFPNNAWTDAGLSNVPSIDKLVSSEAMQNDPCCVSIDVWYDNGTIKVRSLRIDTEVVRYLTLRYTKT